MFQTKLLKIARTFKEGMHNFYRNGWLSFATVSVLAISLYIISVTLLIGITANMVLKNMQEKINVSVYFNPSVPQESILSIKNQLMTYSEIQSIEFVSKDQAFSDLKQISENDASIKQAIEVIGDNPLLSSLVIKAKSNDQYDIIVKAISNSAFRDQINRITYDENREIIARLNTIVHLVEQVGLTLGIVFVFIGVLITFNAIRLTMYAHKQEFEIMRLVGASNMYIRMPFIFEGIFYGIASAIIVVLLLFATVKFVAPITRDSIPQGDLMAFYLGHFWTSLGGLILSGIVLGTVSSTIAIRRYLKI